MSDSSNSNVSFEKNKSEWNYKTEWALRELNLNETEKQERDTLLQHHLVKVTSTMEHKKFNNTVRAMYYTLLSQYTISPNLVIDVITSVIGCFCPDIKQKSISMLSYCNIAIAIAISLVLFLSL